MGRYYRSIYGRGGKFALGSQPSTDPGDFFGMEELSQTHITYYVAGKEEEEIKKKVDKLYDELKVPQEERVYYIPTDGSANEVNEANNAFYRMIYKYCYHKVNRNEVKRYDRIDGFDHEQFYCSEKHKTLIEKFKGSSLCASRVRLGVVILSDIKDNGDCELEAEL